MESLLTVERKQKLDLLLHLLANIQDTLIVRGEIGSGKTALLTSVVKRKIPGCDILLLNAELSLSFESIQYEVLQFINEKYQLDNRSIADVLLTYDKQDEKVVLIIDDAGVLITGLINALVNYSKEYPALKLVFSVTPEELLLKEKTDNLKENCHFIDLLNLDFQQSSEYIQQLMASDRSAPYAEAKSDLLADIFEETKGNLGKINDYIKSANDNFLSSRAILFLLVIGVAIASGGLSAYLWRDSSTNIKKAVEVKSGQVLKKEKISVVTNNSRVNLAKKTELPVVIEVLPLIVDQPIAPKIDIPKVEIPIIERPKIEPVIQVGEKIKLSQPESLKDTPQKKGLSNSIEVAEVVTEKSTQLMPSEPEFVAQQKSVIAKKDDRLWVLEQKARKYTLQLMAVSAENALIKEQSQLRALGHSTYYLIKTTNEKQVYLLFYGVFDTLDDANKEMKVLPSKYRKSWVRKFSALKKLF